jgi:hypothetical protein
MQKDYKLASAPVSAYRPVFKLTLPFLSLSTAIAVVYYLGQSSLLCLKYKSLQDFEFWRFLSSPLASMNEFHLASNLLGCLVLTLISERQKGSVLHCIDLFIKLFIINLFSLLFYIIVLSCSILYEGAFSYILLIQDEIPSAGLQFLVICELFLLLAESGQGFEGEYKNRFSTAATLLLSAYFIALCCLNFKYVGFLGAVLLALLMRLGMFGYFPTFSTSAIVKGVSVFLRPIDCMLYLPGSYCSSVIIYEGNEEVSMQSHRESHDTNASPKKNGTRTADEEDNSNSDELSKSRYDDVDVQDYVLDKHAPDSTLREQESFEI